MSFSVLLEVLCASPVVCISGSTPLPVTEAEAAAIGAVVAGVLLLPFGNEVETVPVPDADVLGISSVVLLGVVVLHDTKRWFSSTSYVTQESIYFNAIYDLINNKKTEINTIYCILYPQTMWKEK